MASTAAWHPADQAAFYDNSSLDRPLRLIARFEYGQHVGHPDWPDWTPAVLRAGS